MFLLTNLHHFVYLIGVLCRHTNSRVWCCAGVMVCVWRSEDNPGCLTSLLTVFKTGSLADCSICLASWSVTVENSPVSDFYLARGALRLQMYTIMPDFK